jgi:hypothetical protein
MACLSKSFWLVAAFHWVALLYVYSLAFLPPDCTRVGDLVNVLFTPA